MGSTGSCSTIPPVSITKIYTVDISGWQGHSANLPSNQKHGDRFDVFIIWKFQPVLQQTHYTVLGKILKCPVGVAKELQFVRRWINTKTTCQHSVVSGFQRQEVSIFICYDLLLLSCVLQEVIRQKVRRQLTKQQKAAQRRRLQKGEANLETKSRRENQNNIKSSMETSEFWG